MQIMSFNKNDILKQHLQYEPLTLSWFNTKFNKNKINGIKIETPSIIFLNYFMVYII